MGGGERQGWEVVKGKDRRWWKGRIGGGGSGGDGDQGVRGEGGGDGV